MKKEKIRYDILGTEAPQLPESLPRMLILATQNAPTHKKPAILISLFFACFSDLRVNKDVSLSIFAEKVLPLLYAKKNISNQPSISSSSAKDWHACHPCFRAASQLASRSSTKMVLALL